MSKYFGTDGFRGLVGVELTSHHAFEIGRFLGWYLGKTAVGGKAKIVIGKDTRRSCYSLEYALASGITSSGADAYLLHVTTTPSVAYITKTENFDCGVMISASHNPYYDNGIKIFNRFGEKADDELISRIEEYLDGKLSALPYAVKGDIGRTVDFVAGRNRYIGYLVSLGVFSFKGVKVGLDLANGSAWSIGKSVFETLGASVSVIGAEPNGVNINDGVGSTRIENLQKLVKEKGLDIGFAYDGDADRCLCVDENGQVVDGDEILYIYGRYMKERGKLIKNTIVTTVMSNFGLYKSLEELGIEYKQTAVGDRFVYEEMSKNGYMLGGEQSGHIIFSKYATTGDGVLTSLKVMQALLDKEKPLSYLAGQMQKYPQTLQSVKVPNKEKALSNPSVLQAIKTAENRLGDKGRVLVRASGTEPVIRVMSEAKEKSLCDEIVSSIVWEIEKV